MIIKRNFLLFLGTLCISVTLSAQNPSFEWAKQMSGPSSENGTALTMDSSGNIYTIGQFYQTVDFDPSAETYHLTSNGELDIFISKLDPQGNFLWAKQIGGSTFDEPGDIAIDANGNILVGGYFRGTVDLNPGVGEMIVTKPGKEAFLLKLSPDGDFMWAKHWGGNNSSSSNIINAITLDSSGNIVIGGSFEGTNDLNPGTPSFTVTPSGQGDAYISKLDSNGDFLWAITFGGEERYSIDTVETLVVDNSDNIVASGNFYGTDSTFNLQDEGGFYIKLDGSGNLIWAKQTDGEAFPLSLKLDGAGNAYITGKFMGTRDFDPGTEIFNITSSSGYYDIFILKLNASGDFVWAKGFGGSASLGGDSGNSIALDHQGYLYLTGSYVGSGDFDPGPDEFILYPVGFLDMFISKFDTDGNFIYANTFGSIPTGFTIGNCITTNALGNVYVTGSFQNTTDFNPSSEVFNLISAGGDDVFILKLSESLEMDEHSISKNYVTYPNPTKGKFSIEFNSIQTSVDVRLYNLSGQLLMEKRFQDLKILPLEIQQADGIYLLELKDGQGRKSTVKLVKN
ncbi:SBBP repeat-containing protein [Gelidibacter sp. F63206]|uniref:SBBP repeat-containing protein n=1 Tax=Gelidibacter sp. F63206 TaxID=2926425 RepID=UPI001FF2F092|nr:SBBP repeat-containing protein [Gelidibacter sp. F63206]MCK0114727.1 T9SS type A sorting domain-containing protein [Gelidibacter sp. F63206]